MEGNNRVPPGSTTPSARHTAENKKTANDQSSVAFTRKAQVISEPESKMKGLNPPENMPSKTLLQRNPSHLSGKQRLQIGLLRLGCWLTIGTKARNWLADIALNLMEKAAKENDKDIAAELQHVINNNLSPLTAEQMTRFNRQCSHFQPASSRQTASPGQPAPEELERKPQGLTFMTWMYKLYDEDNGVKAFKLMGRQFFDSVDHQLIHNPLRKMAEKEDISEESIAATFVEVALDAVDETSDLDELRKIQTMVNSMFQKYPGATKSEYVLERIEQKLAGSDY